MDRMFTHGFGATIGPNKNKKKFFKGLIYSKNDCYYRMAKEQGLRARSAFKLW